jgi:hypothetical protein
MNEIQELKKQLDRIENCLTGDPAMGQLGLVSRTNNHAKRIAALERYGVYLAGGGAVIGLLWTVWSQWPRK